MCFYCYDYVFLLYVYVWLPWLRLFRVFSSVVRQMPGLTPQRRSTARILPDFCVVLCIFVLFYVLFVLFYVFCVVRCIFVLFYVFCVVLCIFVLFYVFLCCSMYFCVVLYIFVLFYVFLCCSMYCLFCDILCIVCVYICTELLLPGGYPITVKYIISYHICMDGAEICHITKLCDFLHVAWPTEGGFCPSLISARIRWPVVVLRWPLKCSCPLTLRWLMSYMYGAPIPDVSRSRTTTQHSR
jgi:hypothetical protein